MNILEFQMQTFFSPSPFPHNSPTSLLLSLSAGEFLFANLSVNLHLDESWEPRHITQYLGNMGNPSLCLPGVIWG